MQNQFKKKLFLALFILVISIQFVQAGNKTDSLEAYWHFDEASSPIVDQSLDDAKTFNLTANASVGFDISGKMGKAVNLTGASDSVLFYLPTGDTDFGDDSHFTIQYWFKTNTSGINQPVMNRGDNGPEHWQSTITSSNNVRFRVRGTGASNDADISGGTVVVNTWHHVIGVYNDSNGEAQLWFDGVNVGNDTMAAVDGPTTLSKTLNFGMFPGETTRYTGLIDLAAFWNESLNATEIVDLYANGNGLEYPFVPSGIVENASYNITSLIGLLANYTITFDLNVSSTPSQCYVSFSNNDSIVNGTISGSVCTINAQINATEDITLTPKVNDTSNSNIIGTEQPLIIVRRTAISENTSFANFSLQRYIYQSNIDNRINVTHTDITFSFNATDITETITIAALDNTTMNRSLVLDLVDESTISINNSISVIEINLSAFNFTQTISTDATNEHELTIPDNLLDILLRGVNSILALFGDTADFNFTLTNENASFRQLNASANTTTNLTLDWQGKGSTLHNDDEASNVCVDTSTRSYTKTETIEVLINVTQARSFDYSATMENFGNRATEGITITNGSVNRSIDAPTTTYAYTITPEDVGNHTVTINYTFTDGTCQEVDGGGGAGGGGGGGGGGGDTTINVFNVAAGEGENLTIRPRFIEGQCLWNSFNKKTKDCGPYIAEASEPITKCEIIVKSNKSVIPTCTIDNRSIIISLNVTDVKPFFQKPRVEFLITDDRGNTTVLVVQENVWNLGYAINTAPFTFLAIPFIFRENTDEKLDGIYVIPIGSAALVLFLGNNALKKRKKKNKQIVFLPR